MSFLWRLIPNKLAKRIKKYVHEDIDDKYLRRALNIAKLEKTEESFDTIEWRGWSESYQLLERILNVLSGFGGAFLYALELGEFYFRELQMKVRSAKVTRAWIKNATSIGLIKRDKNSHGVTRYQIDQQMLDKIRGILVGALEDLI